MTVTVTPKTTTPIAPEYHIVTPALAEEWLGKNVSNRRVKQGKVRAFARDIKAGNWLMTGELIKFDTTGKLLDGQHRLLAVIAADTAIAAWVLRDLDAAAQKVMDTGAKRTAADMFHIAGYRNSLSVAALAVYAIRYTTVGRDTTEINPTHSEIEEFVVANPDLVDAIERTNRLRKTLAPVQPSLLALSFWVLSRVDFYAAEAFFTAWETKVGLTSGDPLIALDRRLKTAITERQNVNRDEWMSVIFRAWNARRAGTKLQSIPVSSRGSRVGIPVPK